MDPPERIESSTWETIREIVRRHEFEPGRFDYKEVLNPTGGRDHDAIASLRRTVCSMANADGGFVLFGVRDCHHSVAAVEDRIVGIPLGGNLRKEF